MTAIFQRSTNTPLSFVAIAALIAGVAGTAAASNAQSEIQADAPAMVMAQASQTPAEKPATEKTELSKDEIIAKVKEQGYPEVSKIKREREGDQYWVMASDADGKKFELHVNAKTGVITRKEQEGN